ncbi:MAG: hypothetical protein MK135_03960 [Polyangiaceae bacterium]|nr:hypothetical protein [Polyangiaceae bacterium]
MSEKALAQACCSGSAANQFGIVARGNRALVGLRVGEEFSFWSANTQGQLSAFRDATVLDSVFTLGGGVRLFSPRLQIQGSLPLRLQYRALGEEQEFALGFGDAFLNARWILFEDDTEGLIESGSWVPFVEPFIGIGFPTGRPPAESRSPLLADVTGTGDWQLAFGLRTSRYLTEKDVLFANARWGHAFARQVVRLGEQERFRLGEELNFQLSYFHFFNLFWALGGSVDYRVLTEARADGQVVPNSQARRMSVGAQLSYFFRWPSWQLRFGGSFDPPIPGVQANLPYGGVSVGLSLERHFGQKNEYQ